MFPGNGTGDYTIGGLLPGNYFVLIIDQVTNTSQAYGAPGCANVSCLQAGTPIIVGAGGTNGIDFALPARVRSPGEVRKPDGSLLPATVTLIGRDTQAFFDRFQRRPSGRRPCLPAHIVSAPRPPDTSPSGSATPARRAASAAVSSRSARAPPWRT